MNEDLIGDINNGSVSVTSGGSAINGIYVKELTISGILEAIHPSVHVDTNIGILHHHESMSLSNLAPSRLQNNPSEIKSRKATIAEEEDDIDNLINDI
jgi:hypothetical protein